MQTTSHFNDLGLSERLVATLTDMGYDEPTPVQLRAIPSMLQGRDIVAQAQTGTGKTAAFALPILDNIDVNQRHPQAVVLTPTRELANQVAESFENYGKNISGLQVLRIYGGQDYRHQLKNLKQGPQIIVGTPGRIMDHIQNNKLHLNRLKIMVLDEADEMLNMGFLPDVEWILARTASNCQAALFSATIPAKIKKIAQNHLNQPEEFKIKAKQATVSSIDQSYILVNSEQKRELLLRTLEAEPFDAVLIFARTKKDTTEIANKLTDYGFRGSEALNGDMSQPAREKVINRLKQGELSIIVATDVAARGLDVERISHVINYDIPYDAESYVHRIGRTGRAGRDGKAILFVRPGERKMLNHIESTIGHTIRPVDPLSPQHVFNLRQQRLADQVTQCLEQQNLTSESAMISRLVAETGYSEFEIATALAYFAKNATQQGRINPQTKLPSFKEMSKSRQASKTKSKYANRNQTKGKRSKHKSRSDRDSSR